MLRVDAAAIIDQHFESFQQQNEETQQVHEYKEQGRDRSRSPIENFGMPFQPNESESNYEIESEENYFEMFDSSEEESDDEIQIDNDDLQMDDADLQIGEDEIQIEEQEYDEVNFSFDSSFSLQDKLAAWATHYNTSREEVNVLLSILRTNIQIYPKINELYAALHDIRTFIRWIMVIIIYI